MIGFYGNAITLGLYAFSRRIFGVISDVLNNAIANVSYPLYASKQDNLNELKIIFLKNNISFSTYQFACILWFDTDFAVSDSYGFW